MAHEELKKLYEIDMQHSHTPWEFWEYRDELGTWAPLEWTPGWLPGIDYRRKPYAPVWYPIGRHPAEALAEDARKWRELVEFYQDNGIMETANQFLKIIEPKPTLIQGYSAEQWETIIDGKFLCEFSDCEWEADSAFVISTLTAINKTSRVTFSCPVGSRYNYCRPLRTKGVRQPWFGGECPVALGAKVIVTSRAGVVECCQSDDVGWQHKPDHQLDIVEFIEL